MKSTKQKEKEAHSPAFLKKRKMMLVMPVLVVPFITMAFSALGGGSGPKVQDKKEVQGFNMQLPSAENNSDEKFDKMAFYEKARKDSLERIKRMNDDPYYQHSMPGLNPSAATNNFGGPAYPPSGGFAPANTSYQGLSYNDPNEQRVKERLAQLNAALNTPTAVPPNSGYGSSYTNQSPGVTTADIDRLEKMMQAMQTGGGAAEKDPEMDQINNVLGQILDIQHPERVSERLQQNSLKNSGMVFPVTAVNNYDPVSMLQATPSKDSAKDQGNAFFSLNEESVSDKENSIAACMHETQTLVNGAIVKLRLLNDVYVSGQLIPKDNFIFGEAEIRGERLAIKINSLRYGNAIFPVKLSVYDVDGLDGIHIPGAISRDVAKQSGDRAIQSLGMTSLDPSMTAQAMGAGIEAVKSLMSKKVKLVKVTVKSGYQVLLKDDNQKNLK